MYQSGNLDLHWAAYSVQLKVLNSVISVLIYIANNYEFNRKNVLDEDDREIRLLQEQFLPDGDLHSDGFGRMKRFRWNNTGMLFISVMFRHH